MPETGARAAGGATYADGELDPGRHSMTDEEALQTDFYKDVVVGALEEFKEGQLGHDALNDFQNEGSPMAVVAMIFYYSKYGLSFFLSVFLGAPLALVWALVISVIKFVVSWIFYPVIKILQLLCKPVRGCMKLYLMPLEPFYELNTYCCPRITFSLWSTKEDSKYVTVDASGKKKRNERDRRTDVEVSTSHTYDDEMV